MIYWVIFYWQILGIIGAITIGKIFIEEDDDRCK